MSDRQHRRLTIDEQTDLLNQCEVNGSDLASLLREHGLSYDDLRYSVSQAETPLMQGSYTDMGEIRRTVSTIPAVSFFSGAGGLDLGFHRAGFKILASIEKIPVFCETLRLNFPDTKVIGPPDHAGDVSDVEGMSEILKGAGVTAPFEGVFFGGPPCQPFSIAANQRFSKSGSNFKRLGFENKEQGNLLMDYVSLIQKFRPRAFLIENVPGLVELDGGKQVSLVLGLLRDTGYSVTEPTVLNAAHFGVPQNRMRVFIIGQMSDVPFSFPPSESLTVACSKALEKPVEGLPNHLVRNHKAESVQRYMDLEFGQRDRLGRVDRLNPNLPSKTVIAGGTKGGGRSHLHPFIPRTLSVRECARLQTFPDDFVFCGPMARQFTQVGNAVPPLLAFRLAERIRESAFAERNQAPEAEAVIGQAA